MNNLSMQNKLIVVTLSLFLILIVGYAVFSESLNVGGTAFMVSTSYNKLTSISISRNTDYVTAEEEARNQTFYGRPALTFRD